MSAASHVGEDIHTLFKSAFRRLPMACDLLAVRPASPAIRRSSIVFSFADVLTPIRRRQLSLAKASFNIFRSAHFADCAAFSDFIRRLM